MTNSAEGALSAPEALKLRMQEMNRSKSALASNVPSQSQLDVVVSGNGSALGSGSGLGGVQPSSNKQISFSKGALGGYFGAGESGGSATGGHGAGGGSKGHHHHHHGGAGGQHQPNNQSQSSSNHS